MNWLEPQNSVTGNEKKFLEEQLRNEITSGHKLAGVDLEIISRNEASNYILYRSKNDEPVVVHLVWNRSINSQYPSTQFYKYWGEFYDNHMRVDNFGYTE